MWEAAARGAPTARHRATAASATRSTRWATAAGLLVVVVEFGSAALPALRAAATRRPRPNCWARARARLQSVLFGRPAVGVRRVSGDAVQRVSRDAEHRGICWDPLLPGPHARLAPAPRGSWDFVKVGGCP